MTDPRVDSFVRDLLLPTYVEIASSPRLVRDFAVDVYRDAVDDPIHAMLVAAFAERVHRDTHRTPSTNARRTASAAPMNPPNTLASQNDMTTIGPLLVIEDRDPARRPAPLGGRYVSAPTFRTTSAGELVASPVVLYQMQFDGDLHGFHHRYAALTEMPVEKITRAMIVNHMLNSFSFFRMHAMSPTRPW
ncbi:MAG: hypothetical protein ACKV2T_14355 [Kofleriaceae bacterium]